MVSGERLRGEAEKEGDREERREKDGERRKGKRGTSGEGRKEELVVNRNSNRDDQGMKGDEEEREAAAAAAGEKGTASRPGEEGNWNY